MKKLIGILLALILVFSLTGSVMAAPAYKTSDSWFWYYDGVDCGELKVTHNKGLLLEKTFAQFTPAADFFIGLQRDIVGTPVVVFTAHNNICPGGCGICLTCGECACPPVEEVINICPPCQNGQGNNHSNCFNGKEFNENAAWYGFVCECPVCH